MEDRYQHSENGRSVLQADLNAIGEASALADDRVFAELLRLLPFNGTVEACAALSRAAPILVKAKSVEILHLAEHAGDTGIAINAQRYLRQYGCMATITEQAPSGKGIGEDIAARASASGADLIVMGAYGRSRLRELVLGGATRHMMHHAPVPVFLAH